MREPDWIDWELELSPHLLRRMIDRRFNEVDVRRMVDDRFEVEPDVEPGRWVIAARHNARTWHVIVEPDPAERKLVIVTAFAIE